MLLLKWLVSQLVENAKGNLASQIVILVECELAPVSRVEHSYGPVRAGQLIWVTWQRSPGALQDRIRKRCSLRVQVVIVLVSATCGHLI